MAGAGAATGNSADGNSDGHAAAWIGIELREPGRATVISCGRMNSFDQDRPSGGGNG
jgi:hypothetical protein